MKKNLIIISIGLFAVLVAAIIATVALSEKIDFSLRATSTPVPTPTVYVSPTPEPTAEPTPEPTATPEPPPQYTNIVIGIGGDTIAHGKVLENAFTGDVDGIFTYSFDHILKYIKPALEYPDFMMLNLESPVAGQEAGFSKSPSYNFNFPDEIIPALQNAGVDMVLNGNNHAADKGVEGIYHTIDVMDSYGMLHAGTWKSPEDRAVPTIIDVEGIKIGIVSATYSLNGHENSIDKDTLEYIVCYTKESQVQEQIDLCRANGAELIIVSPHMGDEYQKYSRGGVKKYGIAYIGMGADIVVAHHPHVLQASELVQVENEDGTVAEEGVCFWSIGNFMTNQTTLRDQDFALDVRETGIIVYINIQKDNYSGEVKIESIEYLPIWMLRRSDLDPRVYAVLPAGNEIDFEAAPYTELPLSRGNLNALERAWALALKQVGTEWATPLGSIPVRDEIEDGTN